MPISLSTAELLDRLRPGMTVYVPGVSGESLAFYAALRARPEATAGVRFVGVHFPGINRSDYLGLHPEARQRSYFMLPGLRPGLASGRAELLPLDYPGAWRDLADNIEVDLAIAQLTPPDVDGLCSPGVSADFLPAVWKRARQRIGHINPRLPRTIGSFAVRAAELDAVFEADSELVSFDAGTPDERMRRHAALVAGLVRDGDTLQFGVGKLQSAVLGALANHRGLRVWSGMVSTPILELLDAGAIQGRASIEAGVALGDAAFYRRAGQDDAFYFRPVGETHDVRRIAALPSFCAINSGIEVDLFGQVNGDCINGRLLAGVGGLPAFVHGARLSSGGRSIIALPSTTEDASFSRIVPTLGAGGLVALPRHEADQVVTEHGIADLRSKSVHARAQALIAIAAPQFREGLARSWDEISRRL